MDSQLRDPAGPGASLRLRVPPEARYGRYVRERVAEFAASQGVPEADAAEFLPAVAEALANALEHSRCEDEIEVNCWVARGDQLLATVVDRGVGFDPSGGVLEATLPHVLDERGRGLPLMRRCTDVFAVRSAPGQGTAVMLGRYVRGNEGART